MEKKRYEKFKRVVSRRQTGLTVILENVWDSHNVGAVLRSCDSVGIREVFVLHTEKDMVRDKLVIGKRTSAGTSKWLDVHFYTDADACFQHVKQQYDLVLGTHLGEDSKDLYELDLTRSVALLFGNEHDGITAETLKFCDGNFIIPQVGMAESLNISVACALSVYEAYRQRKAAGFYDGEKRMSREAQQELLDTFIERHKERLKPKRIFRAKNE